MPDGDLKTLKRPSLNLEALSLGRLDPACMYAQSPDRAESS